MSPKHSLMVIEKGEGDQSATAREYKMLITCNENLFYGMCFALSLSLPPTDSR